MAIPMQGNDEFTAGCKYRTGEMPAVRIEQVEAGLGTDPKAAMLRFGKGGKRRRGSGFQDHCADVANCGISRWSDPVGVRRR